MSTFGVLPISSSGLGADQTWLDTIGGNIANASDQSTPGKPVYRPEYIDAVPTPSGGPGATSTSGVAPDASQDEVEATHRARLLFLRPDRMAGRTEYEREVAAAMLGDLQTVWSLVGDARGRRRYDTERDAERRVVDEPERDWAPRPPPQLQPAGGEPVGRPAARYLAASPPASGSLRSQSARRVPPGAGRPIRRKAPERGWAGQAPPCHRRLGTGPALPCRCQPDNMSATRLVASALSLVRPPQHPHHRTRIYAGGE